MVLLIKSSAKYLDDDSPVNESVKEAVLDANFL
jgi:hypothetical protein